MITRRKFDQLQRRDVPDTFSEIADLERQLSSLKATLLGHTTSGADDAGVTALRVRRLLKVRRAREEFFEPGLFADPAWDILLESYAAYLLQQRNSISALCDAASVPPTTALRWLNKLEQEGLLLRRDDPLDRRRTWMELTPAAAAAMRRYFDAILIAAPI